MTIGIRPVTPDDADFVSKLHAAIAPYVIISPDSVRWKLAHPVAAARGLALVAEDDGVPVGYARASLEWETSLPGQGTTTVAVLAPHRGRGVGTALAAAAREHLDGIGATTIRAFVCDEDGRRFAEKAGLRVISAGRHQVLDLDALPVEPPAPAGVELRPYSAFAHDPRIVHAVEAATMADEPSDMPIDDVPYDIWHHTTWSSPLLDRELSTVAVVDGAPAAIVQIITAPDGRVGSGFTGCLREYRGRGITAYAKTATLHRARAAGFTRAFTCNDETNAPMLAINNRLGYRFHSTETIMRVDL